MMKPSFLRYKLRVDDIQTNNNAFVAIEHNKRTAEGLAKDIKGIFPDAVIHSYKQIFKDGQSTARVKFSVEVQHG